MLNWRVKIIDPSIIGAMANIDSIECFKRDGCFVFKPGNMIRVSPYKKCLKQFRLPHVMNQYVGKEVKIVRNYISLEENELFRMEPVGFQIKDHVPYFTKSHLCIPEPYIYSHLDERAAILKASLCSTSISMIEEGIVEVILSESNLPMSSSLHGHGKSLRAKMLPGIKHVFSAALSSINDFEYEKTTNKTIHHKYGIMVFRRKNDRENVSTVC